MRTLHFVRHGVVHNPDRIVYGTRDFHLTDEGEDQATQAGVYLSKILHNYYFFPVLHSPTVRTRETAQKLRVGVVRGSSEDITEYRSAFDGTTPTKFVSKARNWARLRNPYTPSWGEPYEAVAQRMDRAAADILQRCHSDAVLVSHQLPIWIYRMWVEGRPMAHDPAARQCSPGSVTSISYDEARMPQRIHYWEPTPKTDTKPT